MIVYHGTTRRRAERICREGFVPRKPSRRVWFAESRAYALRRARTQARRGHDRPVVLTCDININQWRDRLGRKRVVRRGGVIAISGPLPVSVLRSHPGLDQPSSPGELAAWVNRVLGLKPHKGVHPRDPGIERLSRWVARRLTHQPSSQIDPEELLHLARQWLPEFFERGKIDLRRLEDHGEFAHPSSPEELAGWVNRVLGLKPHKGVRPQHPGIGRLAYWVVRRMGRQPVSRIAPGELLYLARQWLPEFFRGVRIDYQRLHAYRKVETIDVVAEAPAPLTHREEEALNCLDAPSPKRRIRGLSILADLGDPDLFEWCVMYLRDESREVRVAALHTMVRCDEADGEVVAPLAESEDKRVRAAAIAVLAKHGGEEAVHWFKRGLKDPSPCVRVGTAALLSRLDPSVHRSIFELALYDPNPQVARLARKLTAGQGYAEVAR